MLEERPMRKNKLRAPNEMQPNTKMENTKHKNGKCLNFYVSASLSKTIHIGGHILSHVSKFVCLKRVTLWES